MEKMFKHVNKINDFLEKKMGELSLKHLAVCFIATFIGITVLTTALICGVTILVIYPVALIFPE